MNAPGIKAGEGHRGDLNAASFLNGKTILLVEDEFLLALQLEELLQSRGGTVLGPFGQLDDAMQAAQREEFDFAILDVNLNGESVWPVAHKLREMDIPFVIATGGHVEPPPPEFKDVPLIEKPYTIDRVTPAIERALAK